MITIYILCADDNDRTYVGKNVRATPHQIFSFSYPPLALLLLLALCESTWRRFDV
jgi:hypothetical protein